MPTDPVRRERTGAAGRSRRTYLQSAGGLVSLFAGGCLGRIDGTTRVPLLVSRDSIVASRRIPRDWRRHVAAVRRARRSLEAVLSGEDGVAGIKVVRSDERYGGRRGLELTVEAYRSLPRLPAEFEGVSLGTETALDRGLSACHNAGRFDPVPGGVVVEPASGGRFGTACCRVFVDGDRRLLTAAHLWEACRTGIEEEPLYQSDRRIGTVESAHRGYDVAVVDPRSDRTRIADTINLEADRYLPVAGSLTEWGVAVFLSEGRPIVNMGVSSGLTRGRLSAAYVEEGWNRCVDFDGHGVEAEYRNVEGDSGGPVFHVRNGKAYLVAPQQMWLQQVGTDCGENIVGNRGRGIASYRLRDELGLDFAS